MAKYNTQNLIPGAHKLTVEEASKGGKNSVKSRKADKTVRKLLENFLSSECKDSPTLSKLANKLGLESDEDIKTLFTATCVINSMKKGNLKDLAILMELLGENATDDFGSEVEDDALTKALEEEAKKMEEEAKEIETEAVKNSVGSVE